MTRNSSKLNHPHNFKFRDVMDMAKTRMVGSMKAAMREGDNSDKLVQVWRKSGAMHFYALSSNIAQSFWSNHENSTLTPAQFVTLLYKHIEECVEAHEIVDCRILPLND